MAKKFLDVIGDTLDDDDLTDIIPKARKKRSTSGSSSPSRKRKRLVDSINENIPAEETTRRKTLLETMEEAFDDAAFDGVFPTRKGAGSIKPDPSLESRFSTMITTQILEKARQIATKRGIRVKDVINTALRLYVDQHA